MHAGSMESGSDSKQRFAGRPNFCSEVLPPLPLNLKRSSTHPRDGACLVPILNIRKYRFLYLPNRSFIALVKGPLLDPLPSNKACVRQNFQVFTRCGMADTQLSGDQQATDSVPHEVSVDLRGKMLPGVLQPEQYFDPLFI